MNIVRKSKIMLHGYKHLYSLHKAENIYRGLVKAVETRFDISNYEFERPLSKGRKNSLNQ